MVQRPCAYIFTTEWMFIPFTFDSELNVLEYERFMINHLQAPMQDRVHQGGYKPHRFRLWKRSREKPSVDKEVSLNIIQHLGQQNWFMNGSLYERMNVFQKYCVCSLFVFHDGGRNLPSGTLQINFEPIKKSKTSIFIRESIARLYYKLLF